jgi:hypothetical protein
MKHAIWVLLGVLCGAMLLFAQEEKHQKMTGTICNSKCVVQQSGLPTCDPTCTDKSGDPVLVSDKGHVMKIENPNMAMPHMNKHVTMMAVPSEKEREESIRIMELYEMGP